MTKRREDVIEMVKWMDGEYPVTASFLLEFVKEFDDLCVENERLSNQNFDLRTQVKELEAKEMNAWHEKYGRLK